MKKLFLLATAILFSFQGHAQLQTPQPSPKSSLKQNVGLTEFNIEYSRPSMRDREVFGNLVPYGKMWRAGANQNTVISFNTMVNFNGTELKPGSYAIYVTPHKKYWEVYLYNDTSNWGLPQNWDESKVVASLKAETHKTATTQETFTIYFSDLHNDGANLVMHWENTMVKLPVQLPTQELTMKNIEKTLNGPTANDYYAAANYYYESGNDIKQALTWIGKSVEMQNGKAPFWVLRKKSLIEAKAGLKEQAIESAKASLAGARKAGNADYIKMNTDSLKEWGAM
ncbi:DUF2911 domain-containing protein [Mesonia sp. HuA40]|uniref:DUF2911 domain-containing protein n=1 Tax=Mesonia sp. HuA40 TaxID=2602761 RepID=UPI0011CA6565|nr:DUF2911 domain-containing protein [Mesonia sp. HuA40]TXK70891.1 DUF2911 domain-containing protein [Mesonia sp. HuA40]